MVTSSRPKKTFDVQLAPYTSSLHKSKRRYGNLIKLIHKSERIYENFVKLPSRVYVLSLHGLTIDPSLRERILNGKDRWLRVPLHAPCPSSLDLIKNRAKQSALGEVQQTAVLGLRLLEALGDKDPEPQRP